jgi:hypothetical protein
MMLLNERIQRYSLEEANRNGLAEAVIFDADQSGKEKTYPLHIFWREQLTETLDAHAW